ncbi:hypothetical protein [Pseudotenacibaculum haliotis]|uniref:Uncharacterized protein n=1 Tax=Pseudotenacibaculum haliotis TaxID=1862138 RepID=A0ABW5LN83_9FLAO
MGKIKCKNHGESFIILVSNKLREYLLNNEKTQVTKLIFKINNLSDFIYFFAEVEDIEKFKNVKEFEEFERIHSELPLESPYCENCFFEYKKTYEINLKDVVIELDYSDGVDL